MTRGRSILVVLAALASDASRHQQLVPPKARGGHIMGRFGAMVLVFVTAAAAVAADPSRRFVYPGADGKLVHETDDRGNRIRDFSHCGYAGGGVAIPDGPVRVVVSPGKGDNGSRIQA